MIRALACVLIVGVICLSSASDNVRAVAVPAARSSAGLLTFSDSSTYNSYTFAGSPLGLLDVLTGPVLVDLEYRLMKFHSETGPDNLFIGNSGAIPTFALGVPHSVFVVGSYLPWNARTLSAKLSMQQFNFAFVAGSPSGIVSFGVAGEGYAGRLQKTGSTDYRRIMGVDNLGLYLGSQVAPMVRLGVHAASDALFDSLVQTTSPGDTLDRYFTGNIPRIGGDLDFGSPELPVQSDLSVEWAQRRTIRAFKPYGDVSALMQDSLAWNWQAQGSLPFDKMTYSPAIALGAWSTNSQVHDTAHKNENPFLIGSALPGSSWKISSFHWGLGGSCAYGSLARVSVEYVNTGLDMKANAAYGLAESKRSYHRTALGLTGNLHEIKVFRFPQWLQVSLSLGYLNLLDNALINGYRARDIGFATEAVSVNSQAWRYQPLYGAGIDERIQRFSIGASTGFLDRTITLDTFLAWLSRKRANTLEKGFEFGIDLAYQVKGPQ